MSPETEAEGADRWRGEGPFTQIDSPLPAVAVIAPESFICWVTTEIASGWCPAKSPWNLLA
jgi:hypothetical protein